MATISLPRLETIRPATFLDVVRSEWTKVRSVRSTMWTLLIAAFLCISLAGLISWAAASHYAQRTTVWDPTAISLTGFGFGQLVVAILGVLAVSSEYSSGMIRASLAAVPRRGRMLLAKLTVFGIVIVIFGEITSFISFFLGQAIIGAYQGVPTATLSQPGVLRAVIGAGLLLVGTGLLGLALGLLIRHSAGGIAITVALLFVAPIVASVLPDTWGHDIAKWFPPNAGGNIDNVHRAAHTLPAWWGFADFIGFVALMLLAGWILLEYRDA